MDTSETFLGGMIYNGTSVLEPTSFQKTEKRFVRKPNLLFLLPERYVTDHKGISMKGLSGSELRPEVLSDN